MSPAVLEAANRLSGGKARPAVDFLQYDPRVAPAVQYAFGNVFICQVRCAGRVAGRSRAGAASDVLDAEEQDCAVGHYL